MHWAIIDARAGYTGRYENDRVITSERILYSKQLPQIGVFARQKLPCSRHKIVAGHVHLSK